MKTLIKYIFTGFFSIVAFSCSNDFLKTDADISATTVSSPLYISPNWDVTDYSITVQGAGSAKFTVEKTPNWLNMNTLSGQFNNDVATLNCSATTQNDFSAIGIYNAPMILNIDGKGKVPVIVGYISEGNPAIQVPTDLTIQYDYSSNMSGTQLSIGNTGNGILLWHITEKPDWINIVDMSSGLPLPNNTLLALAQNMSNTLNISLNNDSIPLSNLKGKIIIESNDKNHKQSTINVTFNPGTPNFYTSNNNQIIFGRTETTQNLDFYNQGSGILVWKIDSLPNWLSVSETSGILTPSFNWKTLTFTCNRSLIPNGQQTKTIYLRTNDPKYLTFPITVSVANFVSNPENIRAIDGTVTDARMDKTSDILYLATSQPNYLVAYNTKTRTVDKKLSLSKAPNCFSISEDGHKAIVGHGGLISLVNMDNFTVTKTVEDDYNIFDIEWGANNWCCFTPQSDGQYSYLQWKNLDTGETNTVPYGSNVYGKSLVKKIPNQNYIIGSRLEIYPSGITVIDFQNRNEIKYFHQDLSNFWFSSDGNYIFSSYNQIFRTSSILTSSDNVSSIGSFSPSPSQIQWIDHSQTSHSVWVLSSSYDYYNTQSILKYEDNDYKQVNTYYFDDNYKGSSAQAQYIFANNAGSEVVVIKSNAQNAWAIEHIAVTN